MPHCPTGSAALRFLVLLPALVAVARSEFRGGEACPPLATVAGTVHRGCAPERGGGWLVGGGWMVASLGVPPSRGAMARPVVFSGNRPAWPEGLSFRPAVRPLPPREPEAAEEPLTTDRPGFSDGVNVVATGVMQLESGFGWSGYSDGVSTERVFSAGSPLLRLGVGHRTEVRVASDGFRRHSVRSGTVRDRVGGMTDPSIGVKVSMVAETRQRPALSLISSASLPWGNSRFRSAGVDPTVKLAWSKEIDRGITAGGNFNVAAPSDDGGRFLQRSLSVQLSRAMWRKWGGFGEAYWIAQPARNAQGVWAVDAGLSRPIGREAQFDISMGQQVAPFQRSWFVSAGFVVRRHLGFRGLH